MPGLLSRVRRREDSGFTLVELLVVIVLLGIVSAIFMTTVVSATRVDSKTRARADAQQDITVSMQRLTKQVRVAAPLVSVSAQQVVADVYPTAAGTVRHRYTYTVTAGNLTEQVEVFSPATSLSASSTTSRVLARGLQPNPSESTCGGPAATAHFVGCDRAGVVSNVPVRVASVRVRLTGQARDAKRLPVTTDIFLRNYQG